MATLLAEEHPELFHYTGIGGLEGIIKNQTLLATHAAFLNDPSELKEFNMRLPSILRPMLENVIAQSIKVPANKALIEERWGIIKVREEFMTGMAGGMYTALLGTPDVPSSTEFYITSFCTVEKGNEQIKQHGLLSQWRGYGQEGGYAIVFDTARLVSLLEQEAKKWEPEYDLFGGDVVYSSDSDEKFREEMGEDIETILNSYRNYLMTNSDQHLENVYHPLVRCACRYKHWGFHEEKEVRVIAIPPNKEVVQELIAKGLLIKEKERHHFVRGGTLVPCLHLFDGITQLPDTPLPITRIIVGPHRDKDKRRHAIEVLLKQYRLNIPVLVSEIPYVGSF